MKIEKCVPGAQIIARIAYTAAGGPGGYRGPAVHVLVIKRDGLTLEEWADGAVKAITDLQGDITVARREPARLAPTALANGTEALVLDLENPRGIEPLKQRMLLAVTAERAYALVATGRRSEMAAAEDTLRTCFETFTVW